MKKLIVIIMTVVAITTIGIALYAQTSNANVNKQVEEWEVLAEKGDTAAMHRLIEFYDENSSEFVEVEAIIDCDGEEVPQEKVDSINDANRISAEMSKEYAERLDYWLKKGLTMNEPVALVTKGMRLYYTDANESIKYLSKVAQKGNAQAALFCGSVCLNQWKAPFSQS